MSSTVPSLASKTFPERPSASPWPTLFVGAFWRVVSESGLLPRRRDDGCEVARFIDRNGGRLTDSLEREIGRRFGSPVH